MLQEQYIGKIIGLEDVIVTNVQTVDEQMSIELELERKPHTCPQCDALTDQVHDYRIQKIRDLPAFGNSVLLLLRKRRYRCPECGKRFYETNDFLTRYHQFTNRSRIHLISSFSQMRSATSIAKEHSCSTTTAIRYFNQVSHPLAHLPEALSIDEFKGNAGGEKFQCILTNPKKHKVLDILPSRKLEDLCQYFNQFSKAEKNQVRYVVMDMSGEFKSMARTIFPNAKIVADKFHVVRYVVWALERARIRIQKSFGTIRRKYFKRSRFLLLRKNGELSSKQKEQLSVMLDLSSELAQAYALKERFYEVMACNEKAEAKKKLSEWMMFAQVLNIPEFEKVITTISNWSKEFLNAFSSKLTNGFTEGMNNRTKVLKRTCYGVRNFQRFRNRILYLQATTIPPENTGRKNKKKKHKTTKTAKKKAA